MPDALIGAVVQVLEQTFPICRKRAVINGKAVVLRCDVALVRTRDTNRLVMSAMTVLELVGLGACLSAHEHPSVI